MKAIQTRYKGYHFRSRLEARWAVFFDALGLQWEYEPEGFDLGDAGWYLPDFRVAFKSTDGYTYLLWFEVKPGLVDISSVDLAKINSFGIHESIVILDGPPDLKPYAFPNSGSEMVQETWIYSRKKCPWAIFSDDDKEVFYEADCEYHLPMSNPGNWLADYRAATNKARSARFEHGETPQ